MCSQMYVELYFTKRDDPEEKVDIEITRNLQELNIAFLSFLF